MFDLTYQQQSVLDQLANDFASVRVRNAQKGTLSVYLDCFEESPHPDQPLPEPVQIVRVFPSGDSLNVTPGQPGVRGTGGQL